MQERKNLFDKRTAQYLDLGFDRFAAADFAVMAAGELTGSALDIGTGKGITAMALARRGLDVISVDVEADEQSLAAFMAEEAGLKDRISFVCGDASSLSYPDNYFGCIVMMSVLHHLLDPLAVFKEAVRVLRPDGVLVIAEFTPEGFDILSRLHKEEGREHHVGGVSMDEAREIFCQKDFEVLSKRTAYKQDVLVLKKMKTCGGDE